MGLSLIFTMGRNLGSLRLMVKKHLACLFTTSLILDSTVLQDPDGQFIGLTVAEDLAFALENDCVSLEEMQEKVVHWAKGLI